MELINSRRVALLLLISSLLLVTFPAQCQTWDEVFKQKETQKKYLLEQIVALEIYAGYLKKGYEIAGTGLQTVKDISNGEFKLHRSFISSLKTASPAIRNDVRVVEIIAFQLGIRNAFKEISESENLSASNSAYIQSVRDKVLKECAGDLKELLLTVTSGRVEMSEDGRMWRLENIYESMKDKFAFTRSFCNHVHTLIRQKENEHRSVNEIQQLYENE